MRKRKYSRKVIKLDNCEPFPALVDMNHADRWGRYYGVGDCMGAPFYPDCISDEDPKFENDYKELERRL